MNLNINAGSIGERIVMCLAILGLVVEMLSDNKCNAPQPPAEPMTIEDCAQLCWTQGDTVHRIEGFACECHHVGYLP